MPLRLPGVLWPFQGRTRALYTDWTNDYDND